MFRKKRKKLILYADYLSTKYAISTERAEVQVKEKVSKQDNKAPKLETELPAVTLVIAICSLEQKCGCTHLARAIQNFYEYYGYHACIVSSQVPKTYSEISNLYEHYQVIILDIGTDKGHYQEEIQRASLKVLLCLPKENQSSLASFVQHNKNWIYVFNLVPKEKKRKIEALMEDYPCYFLPVFDDNDIGIVMKNIFQQILPLKMIEKR